MEGFFSDNEHSSAENNETPNKIQKIKGKSRVSAYSKVNFSKLRRDEKDERLQNLASLVKKLRKKVNTLEEFSNEASNTAVSKMINKKLQSNKLLSKKRDIKEKDGKQFDVELLCDAINTLRANEEAEFEDESQVIENLINQIAEGKLTTDSLQFKLISTQLRLLDNSEEPELINPNDKKVTLSFDDRQVVISYDELNHYNEYCNNAGVMRMILGLNELPPKEVNVRKESNGEL
jgi:hypothetical protein